VAAGNQRANPRRWPGPDRSFGSSARDATTVVAGPRRASRRHAACGMGAGREHAMTPATKPDLEVRVAGISFKNPIIAASGTFGYGVEFEDVVELDKLGGFVVKGLSNEPMT